MINAQRSGDYKPPQAKPRSRKAMIEYLRQHPRYYTMHSWNLSTSYARNVKVHHVVPADIHNEYEMLDVPAAFVEYSQILSRFAERWNWRWQLDHNGKSGGYVVVYQGGRGESEYTCACRACGQLRYGEIPADKRCGRCGEAEVEPPQEKIYRSWSRPGLGVDMDNDFDEWSTDELRSRVEMVWDFDKTVDRAIAAFVKFCRKHQVVDDVVMVPKPIKRAVLI